MGSSTGTRRGFVGGALAGAALLGPAALLPRRRESAPAPVSGGGEALPADAREIGHWTAAIGRRFRLTAGDAATHATLTHVEPAIVAGTRPAGLRERPFQLRFTVPAAAHLPEGGAIYALDRPIAGLAELFMTHAPAAAGRVVLTAAIG